MVDINRYVNSEDVILLCNEIDMPEEVTKQIINFVDNCDYSQVNAVFKDLFQSDTGKSATTVIHELCDDDESGLKELSVYLIAALHTRGIYEEKGIDNEIFIDTMKMFSRFVRENLSSFGFYGFNRGWWTYRILASSLFRLGELEFEMVPLNKDVENLAKIGDPVISIHIPSDVRLCKEEAHRSYQMAKTFFCKYFEDYEYKFMFCYSWLLSPVLKDMLKPASNIIIFQEDFRQVSYHADDNNFMEWVYKKEYNDYSQLPEDNSLRRNIKQHLLKGGKIGCAFCILEYN